MSQIQKLTKQLKAMSEELKASNEENMQMRNMLFAIIKDQGRVRFSKAAVESLMAEDRIDVKEMADDYVVTFNPGTMVVPGGVKNGQANGKMH